MPTPAACVHCGHVSYLPDGWASPGFTCPACGRASAAPLAAPLPPPVLIVAPPAADPLDFDDAPPVRIRHTHDHGLQRSAFAAGFNGAMGCVLGVAAGVLVLIGGLVFLVAAAAR